MKQKRNFSERPNNRCLYCPKRLSEPRECNGPRTGSMTTERWREYMRDIKEVDGLTFEEIAARTGGQMSTASIQNALAPNANRDLNRETARIIENAIFGVSVADPCPVDLLAGSTDDAKKVADLIAEIADLRKGRAAIHESFDREVEAIRAEAQKKVEFLLAENQRLHKVIDRLLEK